MTSQPLLPHLTLPEREHGREFSDRTTNAGLASSFFTYQSLLGAYPDSLARLMLSNETVVAFLPFGQRPVRSLRRINGNIDRMEGEMAAMSRGR